MVIDDPGSETIYNGSKACTGCGIICTPYEAMVSETTLCASCRRDKAEKHVKGRMVS
jgi:hypothetical protein